MQTFRITFFTECLSNYLKLSSFEFFNLKCSYDTSKQGEIQIKIKLVNITLIVIYGLTIQEKLRDFAETATEESTVFTINPHSIT